jgi:hypothetical protein
MSAASAIVAAPPPKSDRDRAELVGPVKSVELSWRANHKDSYGEVEERNLGVTTYDKDGQLLLDREYTGDFIRERTPERHGANETLLKSKMGDALERYVFDAAGNEIEYREWYGDKPDGPPNILNRMTYDAAGRMLTRESFDENGKSFGVTIYTRDASGRVTVEEDRDKDRTPPYPRMHYTYQLDARGNWIEKDVRRENVREDDYDSRYAGNLLRTITYD